MKNYVDTCTACILREAQMEMLKQELNEYKLKYKEAIADEPKKKHRKPRYPPSGYD